LDLLYGKDRPPSVSSGDMQAKMLALAEEANRKAAELEEREGGSSTAQANKRK
jgi:hypothetical protein